jgi:hypothetical protein
VRAQAESVRELGAEKKKLMYESGGNGRKENLRY